MKKFKLIAGLVITGVLVVSIPVVSAAPLLSRVNSGMREAGITVNPTNWTGWGEGVVTGHYKTYQQLVDAMKWHKQQGRLFPDTSKFTQAVSSTKLGVATTIDAATGKVKCMNSVRVNSLSKKAISVEYAKGKFRSVKLTTAQYNTAIGRSIQRDATVKVCSRDNFKTLAGNMTGIAGLANSSDGGGGGGNDSGGGGAVDSGGGGT
ncbi:MAG: hypothetical protein A3G57_01915 [Candidatus Andersenbacteria bacterium RIFCSPLOWO2_12_FULL_45_8]|nr:MAG: hypothetical protein UW94_C0005G0150 [Parcubacteria group bacterium GW2011_GWA2_45_14]OGY33263.1 MAG: hypothetical protein A3B76_01055 [Candidatus Andersenbacteria bacterium RIFCSPHIGHO2_02_FULL_46_16]OGY38434.1 MAG: hypothetical protein A3I08_02705 [Candidatus Andersenbacteria bacterium RIFCSPLOWO2_02_FULL_46_11]OGY41563.1 MAG: hypothetical protein A3G57_01915 [Candidatus Andersenbacteria bacterium RIFCSPLOWO2_12_FULL_45_8]HBE90862.1 hypothetical protein [Candidatus Andersenbacteria ba